MGGALNGIFGGGGILGMALNIASMFFPPLQIVSSLTNLLTQTLGTALKAGIDSLVQQFGMPKFVGDLAKGIIDKVISANQQQTDPAADQAVGNAVGDKVQNWGQELMKDFVEKVVDKVKDAKTNGKKPSAGSWLEAIALAMADAMSAKASKMIDLSEKIKTLSEQKIDEKDQNALKKNAGELNRANAAMNAAGKEYELLTNTMKNVVDSIGNAMSQAARKS